MRLLAESVVWREAHGPGARSGMARGGTWPEGAVWFGARRHVAGGRGLEWREAARGRRARFGMARGGTWPEGAVTKSADTRKAVCA